MIDQMLQQKLYIDSRVLHLFSCLIMQLTIKYLTVIAWKVKKHNRKSIWLTILLTFRLLVPETVLVISSESGYCWFLLKSCDYSQRTRLTPWIFFLQTNSKNSLYLHRLVKLDIECVKILSSSAKKWRKVLWNALSLPPRKSNVYDSV